MVHLLKISNMKQNGQTQRFVVVKFSKDMSTGQSWTLWQRLPPRYQLTTKNITLLEPEEPKLHNTPRGDCSRPSSSHVYRNNEERKMTENKPKERLKSKSNITMPMFSFPNRRSGYVNHFVTQQRVNSARAKLAETPPTPVSAPKSRARTAPSFPVTNPSICRDKFETPDKTEMPRTLNTPKPRTANAHKRNLFYPLQERDKWSTEATKVVAVTDMFQIETSSSDSMMSTPPKRQNAQKKYTVQETQDGTLYIDNGKVFYFRKSRHDLTNLLKTQSIKSDPSCFLAELRKEYLKHPKYHSGQREGRLSRSGILDPKKVVQERLDYNRRTGHILNYYSNTDRESYGKMPTESRDSTTRVTSPRQGRFKGLCLTPAPSRPSSRLEDEEEKDGYVQSGEFVKLNSQSKLHSRKFYLRTAGVAMPKTGAQTITAKDIEKCTCSICRYEMQLALVAGMDKQLALAAMLPNAGITVENLQNGPIHDHSQTELENPQEPEITETKESSETSENKNKNNSSESPHEQTLTIRCTIPEPTRDTPDILVGSESGFESSAEPMTNRSFV